MGAILSSLINKNRSENSIQNNDKLIKRIMLANTLALCATSLADALLVFLDELIAARSLGVSAMAAIRLASPAFSIICLLPGVLALGAQCVSSYYMNKGDRKATSSIFTVTIVLSSIIALIMIICGFLFLNPLCTLFGARESDPQVYSILYDYLMGVLWVIPGFTGSLILSPFVLLDGNGRCVTIAYFVELFVSAVGDVIVVYVFGLGLYGIGVTTGLGTTAATIIMLTNFRKKSSFHFNIRLMNPKYLGKIIWMGSPRFSRYISGILSGIFVNNIIVLFGGNMAVAVFSVNDSISTFLYMFGYGISESVVLSTQLLYEERDRKELYKMMRIALRFAFIITGIIMIAMILLSRNIAEIFVRKRENLILTFTVLSLICLAVSVPIYTVNCIVVGYLEGARKIALAKCMTLLQRFIAHIVAIFVLGYFFGAIGLFIAIPAGELLTLLIYLTLALFYRKANTIKGKFLFIPSSFDENLVCSLSFSVKNKDEAVMVSECIPELLRKEGYPPNKSIFNLSLCIEELVGNIVRHGFNSDGKKHSCDIRVMLYKDDSINVCVRDDCPKFDIEKEYENLCNEEQFSKTGIKLMFGVAKKISCNHLLGFNNTEVRI